MTPDATNSVPPDFTITHDPLATATDPNATGSVGSGPTSPLPVDVTMEELGRGAMGVVYKATQPGLNRPVAVKMLLGEAADPRQSLRFLAEAEAVAAIDHPHVVRVYEFGRRDGKPFLAMEYLPGGTLSDQLASGGRKSPVEAATLVRKLALGVAAAHAAGIVHRDLKPANVLFDAAGEPKVTDFGLAKRGVSDLTRTQAVMGTPAYMSPEQAKGETKFVGPPADVWALGVILYECLTGKRPFIAADTWALLQVVMSAEPASLRSISGDVPRDVELIVAKCLRKDPAERYATAGELAEDLRRYLAGEPILARPVLAAVRGWKWAKRNRAVAASMAAVILSLATGAVIATWQAIRANAEAIRADGEKAAAQKAAERERERAAGEERERRRADAEKAAAVASDLDSRRQLSRAAVAEGTRLADRGDTTQALAWFAEAHRVFGDSEHDTAFADRLASHLTLGRVPMTTEPPATLVGGREWASWNGALQAGYDEQNTGIVVRVRATGRQIGPHLNHMAQIQTVAFSPDARRVVTAGADRFARVWEVASGRTLAWSPRHNGIVERASFSPDGRRVVTVCTDRTVRVWDAATGVALAPLLRESRPVTRVAFSEDGRRLVLATQDLAVRAWDWTAGPTHLRLRHDTGVHAAVFSPDGRRIATCSNDKTARVWDATTGAPITPPLRHGQRVWAVAFSPDGRRIATGSFDHTARVWDAATGDPITPPLRHEGYVWSVAFSPDGRRLLTGSLDAFARLWDIETGRAAGPRIRHDGGIFFARFSPDGRRIATGGGRTAQVSDVDTGQPVAAPMPHDHNITAGQFSPDGRFLATCAMDGHGRVWDAGSGQLIQVLSGHTGGLQTIQFSADGQRVATGGEDQSVRVWDVRTGQPALAPLWHDDSIQGVTFSPDGRRLATHCADRSVRVWDVATGLPIVPPFRHHLLVYMVSFDPTGDRLAIAGEDGFARIWQLPTATRPVPDLVKFAQLHAGGKIVTGGRFVAFTAVERTELAAELKAKYPADFTVTPAQAMAWHREQIADAERDTDWFAVAFHLRVLLKEYAFADVELMLRLRAAEAKLKPREVLPPPR